VGDGNFPGTVFPSGGRSSGTAVGLLFAPVHSGESCRRLALLIKSCSSVPLVTDREVLTHLRFTPAMLIGKGFRRENVYVWDACG
jgi:hypothetical protein